LGRAEISVVIPTFERPEALQVTLAGLAAQTMPASDFEVVVVDDGSQPPLGLRAADWPFRLTVVHQARSGAAAARNVGAARATTDVLVFVDDDITLAPDALEAIGKAVRGADEAVVLGLLRDDDSARATMLEDASDALSRGQHPDDPRLPVEAMPFTHCTTGFLAIRRTAFQRLGGFQDPTGGWPSWDDLDFGYRAHLAGIPTLLAPAATALHRDAAQATFELARDRWWRAAHAAVALFERHPGLRPHLPMFADKTPIDWQLDGWRLIVRKLLRRATAWDVSMWGLGVLHRILDALGVVEGLSRVLAGCAVRGAMVRGYRAGLRARSERAHGT